LEIRLQFSIPLAFEPLACRYGAKYKNVKHLASIDDGHMSYPSLVKFGPRIRKNSLGICPHPLKLLSEHIVLNR